MEITVETDPDTLIGMGESLVAGKGGCLLCHKVTEQGNMRGPDLRGVGGRASTRVPGSSAEAYLTASLVDPGAYVVPEFATAGGASIMPAANIPPAELSPTELKAVVAFLQSLGGEVSVEITAEDVAAAAARKQKAPEPTSTHPGFALLTSEGCVACHDVLTDMRRIGPPLTTVGERLSAAEIRESILEPDAVIAEGYQKGLMLSNFGETLSPEQLDQLVAYLSGEEGLAAQLNHPAIHLLALILIFNFGINWGIRRATASQAGGTDGDGGATAKWSRWGAIVGALVLATGLYLALRDGSPEPAAETGSPAQSEPSPATATSPAVVEAEEEEVEVAAEPGLDGEALFKVTCPACHGADAKGVPGLGKDMTNSAFIQNASDAELAEFIKRGRAADDPMNTTGVVMPPYGANMALSDAEVLAIVQYMRSLSE